VKSFVPVSYGFLVPAEFKNMGNIFSKIT